MKLLLTRRYGAFHSLDFALSSRVELVPHGSATPVDDSQNAWFVLKIRGSCNKPQAQSWCKPTSEQPLLICRSRKSESNEQFIFGHH